MPGARRAVRRIILVEFVSALAVSVAFGTWLVAYAPGSGGGRMLGIWMIGAGLNYAPLTAYAIALIRPGALDAELAEVDTGRELRPLQRPPAMDLRAPFARRPRRAQLGGYAACLALRSAAGPASTAAGSGGAHDLVHHSAIERVEHEIQRPRSHSAACVHLRVMALVLRAERRAVLGRGSSGEVAEGGVERRQGRVADGVRDRRDGVLVAASFSIARTTRIRRSTALQVVPHSSSNRRASDRGASPPRGRRRRAGAPRPTRHRSGPVPGEAPASDRRDRHGAGVLRRRQATAASAPNRLRAYGGSGSSASGQATHSVTRARASGDRSNTVSGPGGCGAKAGAKSTEEVVTGCGMDTWIASPAAISAARAGGRTHTWPRASSRGSAPREAHRR